MRNRIGLVATTIFASVTPLFVVTASADGFRNPPASASALGHSGGNIAYTEDASSIAVNPANMAYATQTSAQVGTVISIVEAKFSSAFGLPKQESNDPVAPLPHAYILTPVTLGDAKLVAGLGLNVPYGRSSKWDEDVAFATSSQYSAELRVFDIKPTVAAKVSDTVTIGGGLDIYYSDLESNQVIPWGMLTGSPATAPGVSNSDADGSAVGANVAANWDVTDAQRLSFIYRSAFDVDYSGDATYSNIPTDGSLPPPLAAILSDETSFDTKIKYPHVFALGYGAEVSDSVKLGVDFEYILASRFKSQPIDLGQNNVLLPSTSIEKDWRDNWTLGTAVDWEFQENWNAHLGYVYIESPIPDRTLSPLETDSNEHLVSVGLAHTMGKNHFNVMYAMGFFDDRKVENNINPAINGEYEFSAQFVGLSYQRDL